MVKTKARFVVTSVQLEKFAGRLSPIQSTAGSWVPVSPVFTPPQLLGRDIRPQVEPVAASEPQSRQLAVSAR